MTKVGDI